LGGAVSHDRPCALEFEQEREGLHRIGLIVDQQQPQAVGGGRPCRRCRVWLRMGTAAAEPRSRRRSASGFTSLGARKPWASWAIWSTIFRKTMKPRMDTMTAASSPSCASVLWSSSWRDSR